ncbi:trehalase-like domain-containing protein [Streptomyces mirabilis]|uniref:trehalase-like domain-containing protein n=1 Tax=Streptomyces mirabilis TaxID=68239 RepID=UPI0036C06060
MKRLPRIEQYGLIGDMQTSAHVCDDGSIDWLCLPRFDSPAVFASLLGTQKHGTWRIAPAAPAGRSSSEAVAERRYRGDSLVLESVWRTQAGSIRVLDFMPPRDGAHQVIRIVEGLTGEVVQQRQLGNFPQAFSHMGLIQSARLLQLLATQSSHHRGAVAVPTPRSTSRSTRQTCADLTPQHA